MDSLAHNVFDINAFNFFFFFPQTQNVLSSTTQIDVQKQEKEMMFIMWDLLTLRPNLHLDLGLG